MVRVCFFCNKNSQSEGTKKRSYHSFPRTQPARLQAWLLNMQHTGPVPTKHQLLCSDHFTDECFDRKCDRTVLLPSAVPTIFNLKNAKSKMPVYDRNSTQSVSVIQPSSSETSTVQCSWANNICEATYDEAEEDLNDITVTDDDLENCTIKSEPSVVWEEELKEIEDPLAISDPAACKEENQVVDNIEGSNDSLYDSDVSETHSLPKRRRVKRKPYTSLAASRRKLRKINVLPKKYRCKNKQLNDNKMKPLSTAILDEMAPAKAKYPPGFTHIGSPKFVSKFSEAISKELIAQSQPVPNEVSVQRDNNASDCEQPCGVETNDSDIQEMSNCEPNKPVVSTPSKQELEIADMLQRDKSELVDAIIMLQNAVRTQYERAETFRRKQRTLAQRLRRSIKKEKTKEQV